MITYLEYGDPSKNSYRFYALQVTQTIFGSWALIRIWGRIGCQGGTRLESWFDREHKAQNAAMKIKKTKERRGYRSVGQGNRTKITRHQES